MIEWLAFQSEDLLSYGATAASERELAIREWPLLADSVEEV
jgi:hypothetical protein